MNINYFKNDFLIGDSDVLILNESDGHVANFGKQWRDHLNVQLDSHNGFNHSEKMLSEVLFNDLDYLKDKTVLEIGAGAGRFSEHIAKYAKELVLVDLSQAIFFNVTKSSNSKKVKADFLELIPNQKFDIVLCRGVLQHTPNPIESILKLYEFIDERGEVFFDIYSTPKIGFLHPKYLFWRPLCLKVIRYESLETFLKKNIKSLLKFKRFVTKLLFNSSSASYHVIPIYDYKGIIDLNESQLEEWAILDTLDGMYAKYDKPMSHKKVLSLMKKNRITVINASKFNNAFQTKLEEI